MAIQLDGLTFKLCQFALDQSFRCDATGPGTAQIFMLRGCRINKDGSLSVYGDPLVYTDHYDDVMVVIGQKDGGQWFSAPYQASSKPGRAWIEHWSYRGKDRGCPTVQPGQYAYKRGWHRGHQALRQAGPVCAIRDLNQNAKLELSDRVDYPFGTGINIHAGGRSSYVGYNSSGCQVIRQGWTGAAWRGFRHIIYNVAAEQDIFHYVVADFAEFGRWHDAEDRTKHRFLRFGSYGERVEELQRALAVRGYYGAALIDGEFGRVTDEGLRVWQTAHGVLPTGCVKLSEVERLTA